jgi:exopolyphosphatase/guanosine-5'-triphosphate,3'-diphosphate pyrophosphatase
MGRRREHLAAIDVGTNAARLKIARVRDGRLDIVHSERAAVEPGQGVFEHGVMARAAIDRLQAALTEFAEICRFHRAEMRAVATSALRSARNRGAVVARMQRTCGIALEVIDGNEEARLTALGVLAGAESGERALCIDIGGGSTEVMLGEGERLAAASSIDVGGVRLQQRVEDDVEALRDAARAAVESLDAALARRWLGKDATALGCSGSVRALVSFATSDARRYVTRHELSSAVDELGRMTLAERRRFFERRRAAVILPAAVILEQTMKRLDLWAVRATRRGLRDGILVEMSRDVRALSARTRRGRSGVVSRVA